MTRGPALVTLAFILLAAAAAAPLSAALDAWFDGTLDAWRTCTGLAEASRVSSLVMPVGVAFLGLALARALWRRQPGPLEIACILAAVGVGVLLVGTLKDILDRPRPGAEFLVPGGGSFPSGHVGNTMVNGVAILTLWWGGARAGSRRWGWLLLGAVVAIVAAARVYERRHWPSDTLGAVAIAGAYGLLALRHPDARWRVGTILVGLTVVILAEVAIARGFKVSLPAGSRASRGTTEQLAFGAAFDQGRLRGDWERDAPDPQRRSAWLLSDDGEIVLPTGGRFDEVRLVARPRNDLQPTECPRLRVAFNGRVLGDPILQPGWRAYVFPTLPADFRGGENVLSLQVSGAERVARGVSGRRAAFSELSLPTATP